MEAIITATIGSKVGMILVGASIPIFLSLISKIIFQVIGKSVIGNVEKAILDIDKPEDKELALAIVKWVEVKVPDKGMGKDRYAIASKIITSAVPVLAGQQEKISQIIEEAVASLDEGLKKIEAEGKNL